METGQYYLRARYYSPKDGRFSQQDTWAGNVYIPVTLQKYLYANGNPVNNIDPSGKMTLMGFSVGGTINKALTATRGLVLRSYVRVFYGLSISGNVLRHILNRHSISSVVQQVQYLVANGQRAVAETLLASRTFFPVDWTASRIYTNVMMGYADAIRNGVVNGTHTFVIQGQRIVLYLEGGKLQSAWGEARVTLEQIQHLL